MTAIVVDPNRIANLLYIVHEWDVMNDQFTVEVQDSEGATLLAITEHDAKAMETGGLDPYTNSGIFFYANHLLRERFAGYAVIGDFPDSNA